MTKKSKRNIAMMLMIPILIIGSVGVMVLISNKKEADQYEYYSGYGVYIPENFYLHGIDVSRYQGRINWHAVAHKNTVKHPVSFAFIKATEGLSIKDPYYEFNKRKAKEAGLIIGSYHYLISNKSGKEQSKYFIKNTDLQKGDLAPVIDVEDYRGDRAQLLNTLKDFINELKKTCSTKPIIYTGAHFYETILGSEFNDYPLWIAHYNRRNGPDISRNWHFWQHTESATVNGIKTKVDMNVFNGDSTSFAQLLIN